VAGKSPLLGLATCSGSKCFHGNAVTKRHAENGGSVENIFFDGSPVMLDKKIIAVDEKNILANLCAMRSRIAQAKSSIPDSYPPR
jgi:hypothetical protein